MNPTLPTAREILGKIAAGLILVGRNEDKEYEWAGTEGQWQEAERLKEDFNN